MRAAQRLRPLEQQAFLMTFRRIAWETPHSLKARLKAP